MNASPEQDALSARWTLEGRIPLSGVADAKLPPMAMNTFARPSRMARIAFTVS